jgi:hypothetical protein
MRQFQFFIPEEHPTSWKRFTDQRVKFQDQLLIGQEHCEERRTPELSWEQAAHNPSAEGRACGKYRTGKHVTRCDPVKKLIGVGIPFLWCTPAGFCVISRFKLHLVTLRTDRLTICGTDRKERHENCLYVADFFALTAI